MPVKIDIEMHCKKCNRKLDCTFPCLLFWKTIKSISEINYAKNVCKYEKPIKAEGKNSNYRVGKDKKQP